MMTALSSRSRATEGHSVENGRSAPPVRMALILRMLGFDTLYDNHFHDDAIAALSGQDRRIVVTRGRELLTRRAVTHGCYVHALKSEVQLREVVERADLARSARPLTLCLHCNVPRPPVDKARVLDRPPPRRKAVLRTLHYLRRMLARVPEGPHWRTMRRLIDGLVPTEQNSGTE